MRYPAEFNFEFRIHFPVYSDQLFPALMGGLYKYLTAGTLANKIMRIYLDTARNRCCPVYSVYIISVNIMVIFYLYYHQMNFIHAGEKPDQKIICMKESLVKNIIEQNNILPVKIFMIFREERISTGE